MSTDLDPLAHVENGDDEMLVANITADGTGCASRVGTAFKHAAEECDRGDHPDRWQHMSTGDGIVQRVWFDLPGLLGWVLLVSSDEFGPQVACRACLSGAHPTDGRTGHEIRCPDRRSLLDDVRELAAKAGAS